MSDTGRGPFDGHEYSASGHLCSQAVLEPRIISLASELHHGPCDVPWTVSTAHRVLSTTLSTRRPAELLLTRLLTQYNALAPINRLPPELFFDILFQLINDPMASSFRRTQLTSIVCVSWRQAVLSHPLLWTNIDLFQKRYAALALERSHGAPIKLTFSPRNVRAGDTEETYTNPISEHAARIAILDLTQSCYSHATLLGTFPPSLPLLHTLSLDANNSHFDAAQLNSALLRDTSIAHSATPALRKLELEGLSLPWTLPLFRGLVYLHIKLRNEFTPTSPSTFRDVLAACPDLETLRLNNVGPDPADPRVNTTVEPVSLPKLNYFQLESSTPNAIACAILALKIIPAVASAKDAVILGFMPNGRDSTGFLWYHLAIGPPTLRVSNAWDPNVRHLLRALPTVRVADFTSDHQATSVARHLRTMLADLDVEQLECFETRNVPRGEIAEALSDRDIGTLKKLRIATVPHATEQERAGHLELLTDFVEELVDGNTVVKGRSVAS
ncbi:hypothetical protein EVG20_g2880 [Dentipellis fragilis]|uniref:Uncharacterized protein n=1 Tax=Dentipellis fragilis TaxID=205917 RepID=A0A4Y9Z5W1_9AGAM|nr:hypothetical protein EVG20_g2880 [Dentipellis fragilis]